MCKVPPGSLEPDHLKSQGGEIAVVTSVFWDLLKVYDKRSAHGPPAPWRVAKKLAEFAQHSSLQAKLVRKAEVEIRQARHPESYRKFLELAQGHRARCFISTAAFDGQTNETTFILCQFRDRTLRPHPWGRHCIYYYYQYSPAIARWLDAHPQCKGPLRFLLRCIAALLSKKFPLKPL